jgi:phage terminase large subunit-like protein
VLADYSGRMAPADWARKAVCAMHYWNGDAIVAERNYGGAMVAETIRHVDPNAVIREVVASRGKMVHPSLEPFALLVKAAS